MSPAARIYRFLFVKTPEPIRALQVGWSIDRSIKHLLKAATRTFDRVVDSGDPCEQHQQNRSSRNIFCRVGSLITNLRLSAAKTSTTVGFCFERRRVAKQLMSSTGRIQKLSVSLKIIVFYLKFFWERHFNPAPLDLLFTLTDFVTLTLCFLSSLSKIMENDIKICPAVKNQWTVPLRQQQTEEPALISK